MKKLISAIIGIFCGVLNGLFGSGGGVVAVPSLELTGLDAKKSHATSVAIIFFLSLVSAVSYGIKGNLNYSMALKYIPWGIAGALLGTFFLKKVPNDLLRRIFGVIILIGAAKNLFF